MSPDYVDLSPSDVCKSKPKVLYLTRTGLMEPLGQSQVLSYLIGLRRDFDITLVSLEKVKDLEDKIKYARLQAVFADHGIKWRPRRFRGGLGPAGVLADILRLFVLAFQEVRKGNAQLVHGRSYIPSFAAMLVSRVASVPYIFDMRGLWPEELITSGKVRRDSLVHRSLQWAEGVMIRNAATVISLTHAAIPYLESSHGRAIRRSHVSVIPTCADLQRFRSKEGIRKPLPVYGCIGTVLSGWFRLDWLAVAFRLLAEKELDARFEIITQDDPTEIRKLLTRDGVPGDRLAIFARQLEEIPDLVQRHSASFMFYAGDGNSELGRSPTRLAEVLGCGVPVFVNTGIGDVSEIVQQDRVGILVGDGNISEIEKAIGRLQGLIADEGTGERCRKTAIERFSLEHGTQNFARVYRRVLEEQTLTKIGGPSAQTD